MEPPGTDREIYLGGGGKTELFRGFLVRGKARKDQFNAFTEGAATLLIFLPWGADCVTPGRGGLNKTKRVDDTKKVSSEIRLCGFDDALDKEEKVKFRGENSIQSTAREPVKSDNTMRGRFRNT